MRVYVTEDDIVGSVPTMSSNPIAKAIKRLLPDAKIAVDPYTIHINDVSYDMPDNILDKAMDMYLHMIPTEAFSFDITL
jgi:hypothetical protein